MKPMQTKLPGIKDLQELQDLPEKIESELKAATKKLKKAVLINFAAVNDWIFKTSKPDYWINEFYNIHEFGVFSEKDDGNSSMIVKTSADYREDIYIYIRYVKGKPMFNICTGVSDYEYSYYLDENDVFVDMPSFMPISVAKKMLLSEINRLEKNISFSKNGIKGYNVNYFEKIKDRMVLTKELKMNRNLLGNLNEIEHLACGKYPRGTLDDQDAIKFLEKALDFFTKSIPNHVQDMIIEKRKTLERVRELAGEEKEIVSMPTMDEIVKESDENFKAWGQPSDKLQEEKKVTGDENERNA
jgi:hypothetical protein